MLGKMDRKGMEKNRNLHVHSRRSSTMKSFYEIALGSNYFQIFNLFLLLTKTK